MGYHREGIGIIEAIRLIIVFAIALFLIPMLVKGVVFVVRGVYRLARAPFKGVVCNHGGN